MCIEKVIKALECCFVKGNCNDCPLSFCNQEVFKTMGKQELAVILELIEESEFHKKTIAENAQMALEVTLEEIEKTKADTVRKMHESIKKHCLDKGIYPAVVARAVEEAAKEILEEKK